MNIQKTILKTEIETSDLWTASPFPTRYLPDGFEFTFDRLLVTRDDRTKITLYEPGDEFMCVTVRADELPTPERVMHPMRACIRKFKRLIESTDHGEWCGLDMKLPFSFDVNYRNCKKVLGLTVAQLCDIVQKQHPKELEDRVMTKIMHRQYTAVIFEDYKLVREENAEEY